MTDETKSDWETFIHEHYGGTEYEKLLMPAEEISTKEPVKKKLKAIYDHGKDSPFESLPNEILLKIVDNMHIKDLLRCGQTCRRIRAVVHDESLWKKINLSCRLLVPTGLLKWLLEHGCEYLNISDQLFGHLNLDQHSKLKYLNLNLNRYYIDTNLIFDPLMSSCHSLERLQLTHFDLNSSLIKKICNQNSKTLKVFKLNSCQSISLSQNNRRFVASYLELNDIQPIIDECVELEELAFCQCRLKRESIDYLVENISPKVLKISLCNNNPARHVHALVGRQGKKGNVVGRYKNLFDPNLIHEVMEKISYHFLNAKDFEVEIQKFRRVPNVEIVHMAPPYEPLFKQEWSDNMSNFRCYE